MKFVCFFLALCLNAQQIGRIAHVGFKVADLEKTRDFYTGKLGIPQAYDQKDAAGRTTLAVFMVNNEQFLEFSPGSPIGFTHVAFLTEKIERAREFIASLGLNPPELRTGRDRTRNFPIQDPEHHRIEFVEYPPDAMQVQSRGKSFIEIGRVRGIERVAIPYNDPAGAETFLNQLKLHGIEVLSPGKPFHMALQSGDARIPPQRDPGGIEIEWR